MKKALAFAVAGAFVVPAVAQAAPSEMKVTGGGKTAEGATIALTAQGNATAAKGQVQYNDHAGYKVHGTVTCVTTGPVDTNGDAEGGEANGFEIAGRLRDGTTFNIKGVDGGQGSDGKGTDLITFAESDDTRCDLEPADAYEALGELAHGNIKIHKTRAASTAKSRRADMRAAKATANASQFNAGAAALAFAALL